VTNLTSKALINDASRVALQKRILHDITTQTDDKISDVLFTDVAVQ
jgi:flagellar basal body-associated protein FliL